MAVMTKSKHSDARRYLGTRTAEVGWLALVGGFCAALVAWLLTFSPQAASAFVLVVMVVALHEYDRRWGSPRCSCSGSWGCCAALLLMTGAVDTDPLSLAPFIATAAIAGLEFARTHVAWSVRRVIILASAGFAVGLPLGLASSPEGAMYATFAYLAGVSGAVLGYNERQSLQESNLRRILLYAMVPIAAYAIAQQALPLPVWDREWLEAFDFTSIGGVDTPIRVYASLNGPGTLAPLLGLALLCCLTVRRHPRGAGERGAADDRPVAHLRALGLGGADRRRRRARHRLSGRSARLILSAAALIVVTSIALAPFSHTASDVISRFSTIGKRAPTPRPWLARRASSSSSRRRSPRRSDTASARRARPRGCTARATCSGRQRPVAAVPGRPDRLQPGHGRPRLIARSAWNGARARAPGQELRLLLFAMLATCSCS